MPTRLLVMLWQPDIERTQVLSLKTKLQALLLPALKLAYEIFEKFQKKYPDEETRLLFVGPEHFFMRKNKTAYSQAQKQIISDTLQEWTKEKPNCIWIPGTLKWHENIEAGTAKRAELLSTMITPLFRYYQNIGQNFQTQPDFLRLSSNTDVDLIRNTAIVYCNGMVKEYDKQTAYQELNEKEQEIATFGFGTRPALIKFADLTLGLEIGPDHDHCLLRKNFASQHLIDAQIVLSESLPSIRDAIACHQDGIFVHCDNHGRENSLVIPFQQGKGQETKSLGKDQTYGLIWWEASIVRASTFPSESEAMAALGKSFAEMSFETLRKVNIYPKKGSLRQL